MYSISKLKARDKKEGSLRGTFASINTIEQRAHLQKEIFKKELERYKLWLLEQGLEASTDFAKTYLNKS